MKTILSEIKNFKRLSRIKTKFKEFLEKMLIGLPIRNSGKNPDKKIVALRADMDALPILETNSISLKIKKAKPKFISAVILWDCNQNLQLQLSMLNWKIGENGVLRDIFMPVVLGCPTTSG